MPSTFTHAQFISDIYDKLDIDTRRFLLYNQNELKTFAQGMDPLYFYKYFYGKKSEKVHLFAKYFHNHKTNEFLITLTNYIKYNYYGKNPEVMAFLYGIISHYILDSTIHPLVVFKTGYFDKNKPNTYKYNGKHHYYEISLDNYLIKTRHDVNPYKFKIHKYCLNTRNISTDLKNVIDFSFKEVFQVNNFSDIYERSLKDMRFIYKYGRYDSWGIKKMLYKFVYLFQKKNKLNLQYVSFHHKINNQYFNTEKKLWCNPTIKSVKSKKSVFELYIIALGKTINIINEINKYIYENKKIDINNLFGNLSYSSGVDCSKKIKYKYFQN